MAKKSRRAQLIKFKKLKEPIIGSKTGTVNRYGGFKGKSKVPVLVSPTVAAGKRALKAFGTKKALRPKSKK